MVTLLGDSLSNKELAAAAFFYKHIKVTWRLSGSAGQPFPFSRNGSTMSFFQGHDAKNKISPSWQACPYFKGHAVPNPFSRTVGKSFPKDIGSTILPSFVLLLPLWGGPSAKLPRSCQWPRNNAHSFCGKPPQSASLFQVCGEHPPNKLFQVS